MTSTTITLRINADGSAAITSLDRVGAAAGKAGKEAEEGGRRGARGIKETSDAARDAARQVGSLTEFVKGLAGAWLSFQGVNAIRNMADSWSDQTSRVKLAIRPHEEAADVMGRLSTIARQTYSNLEMTAEGFTRNATTLNALGKSTAQQLDYAQALNNALVVSGAKGQAAELVMNGLSRAMAEGKMKGDDLNLVLNYGSRVAEVLAQQLGVNVIELRALAAEGKITGDVIFDALVSNMQTLTDEAASMPATIGDAFVLLRNAALQAVGVFDQANGLSEGLAEALIVVADHIGEVVTALSLVAALYGGRYVVSVLAAMAAESKKTAATVALTQAELAEARAAEAAAAAHLGKIRALQAAGMAAAQATAAENALAAAQQRTTAATIAATAAQTAHVTVLGRLGAGMLALVGGPFGLLVGLAGAATYGFLKWRDANNELAIAARETDRIINELNSSSGAARDQALAQADAALRLKNERIAEAKATLAAAEANLAYARSVVMQARDGRSGNAAGAKYLAAIAEVESQREHIAQAQEDLQRLADAAGNIRFEGVVGGFQSTATASADTTTALKAMRQQFADAKKAIDEARQSTSEYRAEQQALILTNEAARGATADQLQALRDEFATGEQLIRQAEAIKTARSGVSRADREAAQVKREAARATEELLRAERDLFDQASAAMAAEQGADVQAQLEYESVVAQVSEKLAEMAMAAEKAGASVTALSDAEAAGTQIVEAAARARDKKIAALAKERDIAGRVLAANSEELRMLSMSAREYAIHAALRGAAAEAAQQYASGVRESAELTAAEAEAIQASTGATHDAIEASQELADILSRYDDIGMDNLVDEIGRVQSVLAEATDPAQIERLQRALGQLRHSLISNIVVSSQQGLRSIQSMSTEGSKAYQAMQIAIDALTVVQAVSAVLNQGQGDPYTAFARMAAMAAAVASLGVSISGFGGGFNDTAAERQATQGTGSVLGDSDAKSESILRATEITADATSELVGINRGMLRALIQLQDGIAGATGMLARGAGDLDWSGFNQKVGTNFWHRYGLAQRLTGWFGARNEVTDQGLRIRGGSIQDLLNNMNVSAYNEMQGRSWWGGRTRTSTAYQGVDEDVANQFELIMRSIVDTVREAAIALGISAEDVEAALETYRQEEIRISLMDLDAEEQQAELQAVFSQIFDGIAGHVVPFIDQFQQVGEGLGETLVRVATSVQVVQESMRYLGLAIDETDPERVAQISVALVEAAGGIEEFITGMQAFANAFAPEEFQFEANASALRDAFEQAGLAVPATREAMWELMQSLDATTEQGREQIATLIRLGATANEYYNALERQEQATIRAAEASREYAALIGDFAGTTTEFRAEISAIRADEAAAVTRANELARAAGRQGAAERDLAHIHRWAAAQVAAAIQQLYTRTQELVQQLYGGGTYVHGQGYIQQEIDDFQAGAVGAINEIDNAMRQMYEAQLAAIQRIEDYLVQMQFGGLSALSPTEQLDAARQQLEVLQLAAQAGDADAMAALPQAAQQYLQLLQGAYASGDEFAAGYEWVRELLQGIVDAGPTIDPPGEEGGVWNGYPGLTPETLAERDATLAEQEAAYRAGLAEQLAQHLGDLALAINVPVLELAALMGVSLSDLAADLGINLEEITGQSVLALASMADALGLRLGVLTSELGLELTDLGDGLRELLGNMGVNLDNITGATVESMAGLAGMLGLSLTELTTALGLELTDLAGGLTELTTNLGIDLGNLTTESTAALAGLARDLGIDLGELSTAVGADLGELTNSQSLLNQTFAAELATLPQRERDLLQPLLQAVTDATTEADANAAIADLEGAVNSLSPAIRDQLAPYLTGVFPAGALDDLDYLSMIHTGIGDLGWALSGIGTTLDAIRNNLSAANQDAGVPHYAAGGWVNSRTTLVAGEAGRELILPNYVSEFLAREGIPVVGGGGSDPSVVAELRRIAERVERVEAAVVRADDRNVTVTADAGRDTVRAIDDSARDPINRRSGVHA